MTSAGLPAGVVLLCGCCTAPGSRQKKEAEEEGGARRDPQYDPDVPHSVIAQVPVIALGADASVPAALAVPRADPATPMGTEAPLVGTELTLIDSLEHKILLIANYDRVRPVHKTDFRMCTRLVKRQEHRLRVAAL